MHITPLEKWIDEKTEGNLFEWQLKKINETLKIAQKSQYYRERLPDSIGGFDELSRLPTMDANDLSEHGNRMICTRQGEIARIVSLSTSGTTALPKRVYFTKEDQELTLDFFAHGLFTLVRSGDVMAIMLPCHSEGGVGDLIARSLRRMSVAPITYGLVSDIAPAANMLRDSCVDSLVGLPVQALALARYCESNGISTSIRSVLLSADNVPHAIVRALKEIWGCDVYEHYGMTEMGLGGAIDCDAHCGMHIRENDLYFEVLDDAGQPLPDGETGEVAFTTLTRKGMPLIRYRTGDISKILSGKCACGSSLRRLAPIQGRKSGFIELSANKLSIAQFDEALFSIREVSDYSMTVFPQDGSLHILVETQKSIGSISASAIADALTAHRLFNGYEVRIELISSCDKLSLYSKAKRAIEVHE